MFMFAAMIRLQREPAGPDVIRVPGGTPVAIALAADRLYDDGDLGRARDAAGR